MSMINIVHFRGAYVTKKDELKFVTLNFEKN